MDQRARPCAHRQGSTVTTCVVYTRFSPRRNAEESVSCETQEDQCYEYARDRGWDIHSMHRDEAVSGKNGPAINRLSEFMRSLKIPGL